MVRVSVPTVRIRGQISGAEALTEAKLAGKPLARFEPRTSKVFDFEEELTLRPGEQSVRFEARTADSPPAEESLSPDYQPPVHRILSVSPPDGSKVYEKEIKLEVELAPQTPLARLEFGGKLRP